MGSIAPFADTPEGGERCRQCFLLRLRSSAGPRKKPVESFLNSNECQPHKT